jgi:GxxExxY protein
LGPDRSRTRAEAQRKTKNQVGTILIKAAITVHRDLGPGLLETVYEVVFAREPDDRGVKVERIA